MSDFNEDQFSLPNTNRPKITETRKPDICYYGGRYYLINGVLQVKGLENKGVEPMTEEETVQFFQDRKSMSESELGVKYMKNPMVSVFESKALAERS